MIQSLVKLVDRVRTEGVANLRPIKRDSYGSEAHGPVVRDIGELEAGDLDPSGRVEDLRNRFRCSGQSASGG